MVDCRPCRESFSEDEVGNAFFTLVQAASSSGWSTASFVVNVLAAGISRPREVKARARSSIERMRK